MAQNDLSAVLNKLDTLSAKVDILSNKVDTLGAKVNALSLPASPEAVEHVQKLLALTQATVMQIQQAQR